MADSVIAPFNRARPLPQPDLQGPFGARGRGKPLRSRWKMHAAMFPGTTTTASHREQRCSSQRRARSRRLVPSIHKNIHRQEVTPWTRSNSCSTSKHHAFEAFRQTNDARLKAIEDNGHAPAELEAKVEKINDELTRLGRDLAEVAKKANRPEPGAAGTAPTPLRGSINRRSAATCAKARTAT